MTINDVAITYEVCEHEGFKYEMNTYHLNPTIPLEKQLKILARKDVAPEVAVVMWENGRQVERTYHFPQYQCRCEGTHEGGTK